MDRVKVSHEKLGQMIANRLRVMEQELNPERMKTHRQILLEYCEEIMLRLQDKESPLS